MKITSNIKRKYLVSIQKDDKKSCNNVYDKIDTSPHIWVGVMVGVLGFIVLRLVIVDLAPPSPCFLWQGTSLDVVASLHIGLSCPKSG